MNILTYILAIISSLTLSAHFLRNADYGIMIIFLIFPLFFLTKKQWLIKIFSGLLLIGTIEWIVTTFSIYSIRSTLGLDYLRMIIIMSLVILLTFISAILQLRQNFLKRYEKNEFDNHKVIAFFSTITLIGFPYTKVSFPILLLERFFPGTGWLEVFLLGIYASFITGKLLQPQLTSIWRRRIWMLFSIVFFTQFILGIIGYEIFLMTGKLHLPIPGIILAGPIYRWSLSFMVFLFLGSIVLLGPAWCSYLCYFGVWDDVASRNKIKPFQLPKKRHIIRIGIFAAIILIAFGLNYFGISALTATILGIIFGIIGIIIMVLYSRKKGVMTHCTLYCPIGLLAVSLGKLSPFRIKINNNCDECAICHLACRYDALNMKDIKNRKPNINCTLCGDCIGTCPHNSIEYKFLGLSPEKARTIFIIMASVIHAAFLGIGRI